MVELDITSSQVPDDVPLDEDEARIMRGLQGSEQMFREVREREEDEIL